MAPTRNLCAPLLSRLLRKTPTVAAEVAQEWFYVAVCERNWKAARQAMAATESNVCRTENVAFPPIWCEGFIERAQGNIAAARAKAFSIARAECEKVVREQPNFGEALSVLGLTEAALGDKQKAIEHGERAVQLVPPSKDAINGPLLIEYLSLIYSWTGEKDRALAELKRATEIPSPTNYWETCASILFGMSCGATHVSSKCRLNGSKVTKDIVFTS